MEINEGDGRILLYSCIIRGKGNDILEEEPDYDGEKDLANGVCCIKKYRCGKFV